MTEKAKKADAPEEKPAPKKARVASYVVAEGKSIAANRQIIGPGEEIKAEDVADIEALIKGGFVVKA